MTRTPARPGAARVVTVASIITVAFMGSVIVTPLYSLYQRKFGFSEVTLTLIYATYVVGNVGALLFSGQISDQIGRRRIALPALAVAGASALLFLFAEGTAWLFAARLLIGLAAGTLSGTGTAWLAETYGPGARGAATVSAATANLIGIAAGPLLAGLLAQYATLPLQLPLLAYLVILAAVAVAIWRAPDTRRPRARLRVRPRIGVPADRLRSFAAPAVTGFVTFALGGLYFALIPSIVIRDLHEKNVAVGGLVVFELGAIAAVLIVLGRRLRPITAMTCGLVCLLPAVALVVGSEAEASLPLLLVATMLGAVTLALGYRGSLQIVNEIAPDDRRGEVVSTYFLACFVGNAIPVIGLGILSTLTDRLVASVIFACTVAVLALAALVWQRRAPYAV